MDANSEPLHVCMYAQCYGGLNDYTDISSEPVEKSHDFIIRYLHSE